MTYRVVYDLGDESLWFVFDPALLAVLGTLVALFLVGIAFEGWLTPAEEIPPRRVGRAMVWLGSIGGVTFGGLFAAWGVSYLACARVALPIGLGVWTGLSALIFFAGLDTVRRPPRSPPLVISTPNRYLLLDAAAVVCWGTIYFTWSYFSTRYQRSTALRAGDAAVVEGPITDVKQSKKGKTFTVAGTSFRTDQLTYTRDGKTTTLLPDLPVRVTHIGGSVLRLEVADTH